MALRRREELWYGGERKRRGGEERSGEKENKPLTLVLSLFHPQKPPPLFSRTPGSYVTHETKHFIYFYLGHYAVLLFKSG